MSTDDSAPAPKAPPFEISTSRQFSAWLAEVGASLAFTTYQAGKLFFIGLKPDGHLWVHERSFERCMGLAAGGLGEPSAGLGRRIARHEPFCLAQAGPDKPLS